MERAFRNTLRPYKEKTPDGCGGQGFLQSHFWMRIPHNFIMKSKCGHRSVTIASE